MSQISESSKKDGSDAHTLSARVQSRKFILACSVLVSATALLIKGLITGDNWVDVASVVTVGYVVGQAWQNRGGR